MFPSQQNSYLCTQLGHENEQIIGYCLYESCENNFPFCVACLMNEDLHSEHKNHRIRFHQIIQFLEKEIELIIPLNQDFQAINQYFLKFEKTIEKNFTSVQKGTKEKLWMIVNKLKHLNHSYKQKISILQNLLLSMQQYDYKKIHQSKQQIRRIFCQNSSYQIFNKIYILFDHTFKQQEIQIKNSKVQWKIQKTAQIILERAKKLIQSDQVLLAQEQIDKAILRNPSLTNAYILKGFVLNQLFNYENAIQSFDIAINIDIKNSLAYQNKGYSLDKLDKYEDAIKCYDKAIKLNPKDSTPYNRKGKSLGKLGKYEEAIKCYDEAIKLNPKDSKPYNRKANSLRNLGKYEEAIKCYDEAIKQDLNNSTTQFKKDNSQIIKLDPINLFGLIKKYYMQQQIQALHKLNKYNQASALQQ